MIILSIFAWFNSWFIDFWFPVNYLFLAGSFWNSNSLLYFWQEFWKNLIYCHYYTWRYIKIRFFNINLYPAISGYYLFIALSIRFICFSISSLSSFVLLRTFLFYTIMYIFFFMCWTDFFTIFILYLLVLNPMMHSSLNLLAYYFFIRIISCFFHFVLSMVFCLRLNLR